MSLLSTFSILFDTDAKKAADDTERLSGALDDVEDSASGAAGGVDNTTKSYNENTQSIGGLTKAMLGMMAAYVTFDAIASGVIDNATQIDSIGKFSQTLGLNIVELDAWGTAVARNGGSAEAFQGTVESMQSSLQDMEITGGGEMINTLAMIGVSATGASGQVKDVFSLLPQIADAFAGMSTAKSFAFGKKLGLDQGTILLLQQGRGEVDKLIERQKSLGGVTKEGYEAAAAFNDQWDDTKRVFNSLWMSANSTILPLLTQFLGGLEGLAEWMRNNQALVEGFFLGVGAVILGVGAAITVAYLPAIMSAAAATIVAIAPFVLIAAAIAAVVVVVALLYEDIKAWVNGTPSALGDLFGSFEDFKNNVLGVFDSISKKWKDFVQSFTDTKKDITDFFDLDFFGDGLDVQHNSGHTASIAGSDMKKNTEYAMGMVNQYESTNLNQGGYNMNQRTQNVSVNVGGANIDARGMSPQQASRAFNDGLNQNIKMAIGQNNDGVDR